MKIAIVSKYFPPDIRGGGEISAYNLAQGLAEQGMEVHVITSRNIHEVAGSKFTLHPVFDVKSSLKIFEPLVHNEFFYKSSFNALDKFLSKHGDFDLLNAWNMYSIPGTVRAAKRHGIPSVITVNSHWLTCPSGQMTRNDPSICTGECGLASMFQCFSSMGFPENIIGPLYSKQLMRKRLSFAEKADAVVSISRSIESYVTNLFKPEKSYVIHNIVEIDRYKQLPKEEFKSDILFLGNLEKPKGCEYLIKSMTGIVKKRPDIKLRIIGRGAEEPLLKRLSNSLKLEKNISFEGFVDYEKIPSYYASTSVVVFPSIWPEPFGRISVEAMASGKPVVAARVGGIPEVVEHEKTGLLVEPGNSSQIAEAVLYLLENEDIAKKMGENGKEEAKKYSSKAISRQYIEVYRRAIDNYRPVHGKSGVK